MKRTILYAYIALMVAVGLPFLADLGGQGAQKSSGAVNPTPTAAVDEAPPSVLPRAADPVTPSPLPDAPEPAALPAPDRLTVLLPDGTVRQVYFYCVDISEFSERNTPFTGCPAKGVFVFLRLFGTVTPRREPSWQDRRSGLL